MRQVIDYRKSKRPNYSRKAFAKALGFASESGLNMVLTNKRELRSPYLDKCIKDLELSTSERIYFEAMVRAGKLTASKRRTLLKDVEKLSAQWNAPAKSEGIRLIDMFLVQQILCLTRTYMHPRDIRRLFRYPISELELVHILEWMEDQNFVSSSEDGSKFKIIRSVLMAKDEITDVSLRNMHHDAFRLAAHALETDPIGDREFQTYLFTLNRSRLPKLKEEIKKLVLRMIGEFESEDDADSIVQLHFHLAEAIDVRELREMRGDI